MVCESQRAVRSPKGAGRMANVDVAELRNKVKGMYRSVAEDPHGEFHFEMGRAMALRLGYHAVDLDAIPSRPSTRSPVSAVP